MAASDLPFKWKTRYVYIFLKEHDDVRYNNIYELYGAIGMYKDTVLKAVRELEEQGYIKWQSRNPDGKYYVLLK